MATSSELVGKAAKAVDASAKATAELQETVKETTDANTDRGAEENRDG